MRTSRGKAWRTPESYSVSHVWPNPCHFANEVDTFGEFETCGSRYGRIASECLFEVDGSTDCYEKPYERIIQHQVCFFHFCDEPKQPIGVNSGVTITFLQESERDLLSLASHLDIEQEGMVPRGEINFDFDYSIDLLRTDSNGSRSGRFDRKATTAGIASYVVRHGLVRRFRRRCSCDVEFLLKSVPDRH